MGEDQTNNIVIYFHTTLKGQYITSVVPICIFSYLPIPIFHPFLLPICRYLPIFFNSIGQGRWSKNHLKFMCVYNITVFVIILITCMGGQFYNGCYQCATNPFHGNESQVVIKHRSHLLKWSFMGFQTLCK